MCDLIQTQFYFNTLLLCTRALAPLLRDHVGPVALDRRLMHRVRCEGLVDRSGNVQAIYRLHMDPYPDQVHYITAPGSREVLAIVAWWIDPTDHWQPPWHGILADAGQNVRLADLTELNDLRLRLQFAALKFRNEHLSHEELQHLFLCEHYGEMQKRTPTEQNCTQENQP
jgi:hypothetical protein